MYPHYSIYAYKGWAGKKGRREMQKKNKILMSTKCGSNVT
jgi:hypothetical protein